MSVDFLQQFLKAAGQNDRQMRHERRRRRSIGHAVISEEPLVLSITKRGRAVGLEVAEAYLRLHFPEKKFEIKAASHSVRAFEVEPVVWENELILENS